MSRPRPISRTTAFNDDKEVMTTVWHKLVDTMRQLPPMDPGTRIITDEESPIRPLASVEHEKKTLDDALEQIEMLIALRRNEEQAIELARHTASQHIPTATSNTPSNNGIKRKRRTSISFSDSPAPGTDGLLSPLPRGGTPASKMRKDEVHLQVGRKVAYRDPKKSEEEWILTTVQRRDPVDKNKYTIVDADDGSVIHSDIRYMVPLPDPSAPRDTEDFPKGSTVLALFPETTTLYRAFVVAPPAFNGKDKDKPRSYRLKFEDDDNLVREIDYSVVARYPG